MIQIYYGFGKGKTSALNGAALRIKGSNMEPVIYRFLKKINSGENHVLINANIPVHLIHHTNKFVIQMNDEEKLQTKQVVVEGMKKIIDEQNKYDVILLDEFLDLMDKTVGFFDEDDLIDFLKKIKKDKEIIITGHQKYKKIFAMADLITFFDPEKHYFDKGIKARKGFEL